MKKQPQGAPNHRAGVDAGWPVWCAGQRAWSGTTQRVRSMLNLAAACSSGAGLEQEAYFGPICSAWKRIVALAGREEMSVVP